MKNNLWHFGDSFACCDLEKENIFSHYIAEHLDMELKHRAKGGSSNYGIFNEIIKELNNFKDGDVMFINWSYLDRSQFFEINNDTIEWIDTSRFIGENGEGDRIPEGDMWYEYMKTKLNFLDNWLKNTLNENVLLFNNLIYNFLQNLKKRKIKSYHIFINKNVNLYQEGNSVGHASTILNKIENEINFEPSYFEWLVSNGYKNEQSVHYTMGIQKQISNYILENIKIK